MIMMVMMAMVMILFLLLPCRTDITLDMCLDFFSGIIFNVTRCHQIIVIMVPVNRSQTLPLVACCPLNKCHFLLQGVDAIKKSAKALAQLQMDCGMSLTEEEFVESFRFGLVQVVYEWARGMPFKEITELTDIKEGTRFKIFSCFQHLLW